ncbi:hypothetical protein ACJX0J_039947 [Zea mays]
MRSQIQESKTNIVGDSRDDIRWYIVAGDEEIYKGAGIMNVNRGQFDSSIFDLVSIYTKNNLTLLLICSSRMVITDLLMYDIITFLSPKTSRTYAQKIVELFSSSAIGSMYGINDIDKTRLHFLNLKKTTRTLMMDMKVVVILWYFIQMTIVTDIKFDVDDFSGKAIIKEDR